MYNNVIQGVNLCPKIGDVLYSNEHSCKVTVEALTTNDKVVCVWQNNKGEPYREIIDISDLKEV